MEGKQCNDHASDKLLTIFAAELFSKLTKEQKAEIIDLIISLLSR